MANERHRAVLEQGVEVWNQWRAVRLLTPDLSEMNFSEADLYGANLRWANLRGSNLREARLRAADLTGADLTGANLHRVDLDEAKLSRANFTRANLINATLLHTIDPGEANFSEADLRGADLSRADLQEAKLRGAKLSRACLSEANLRGANLVDADLHSADLGGADLRAADLSGANLHGADLSQTTLVRTILEKADLTGCRIYGISAWNLKLEGATQTNLVITDFGESTVTVDNLEVAQFIYLLLNNAKIRDVINTITSKAVLILGRFTPERKTILDAIRKELGKHNLLPIIFDFDKSDGRNLTETITTLAGMSRFIIADITDPRSIPQELQAIVPTHPSVPVQPLIESSSSEWGMFESFRGYPWVLEIYRYRDLNDLLESLKEKVISPAEAKAKEIEARAKELEKK